MDTTQYEAALARLTPVERRLYRVLREHGPLTSPDLQKPQGEHWGGRANGARPELDRLLRRGLIQPVGKRGQATRYGVTPLENVEEQLRKNKRRRPRRPSRNGGEAEHRHRINEYQRMEKDLGPSARAHWLEERRKVVELSMRVRRLVPVAFWDAVRDDELEAVWEEIVDLRDAVTRLEQAMDWQRGDTAFRAKIAAMRNTEGRSLEEAELFRRKADELEDQRENGQ